MTFTPEEKYAKLLATLYWIKETTEKAPGEIANHTLYRIHRAAKVALAEVVEEPETDQ